MNTMSNSRTFFTCHVVIKDAMLKDKKEQLKSTKLTQNLILVFFIPKPMAVIENEKIS